MSLIEVKNVTKCYGSTIALKNVSLTFAENKITGLLGRNGAGKTTLINLITNRIFPTEGAVFIDGEPVLDNDAVLSKVYCMSEMSLYPDSMTVSDILKWTKEFYPDMDTEYAQKLADKFSLSTRKKIKSLSTGYKSIYKLIVALSCHAPILLLDEPVLGLDANYRDVFYRELIESYSRVPKTIVLSTHLIEEAAGVIENLAIIKDGEIIMDSTTQNTLQAGVTVTGPAGLVDSFIQGKKVLGQDTLGGIKSAYLLEVLDGSALPQGLELSRLNLQSLFIHLTNSSWREKL